MKSKIEQQKFQNDQGNTEKSLGKKRLANQRQTPRTRGHSSTAWIEVDPIYLTDEKKRPIEVLLFFNRCHYNPATKNPTLRRSSGLQTFAVDSKDEIGEAVVHFVTKPGTRLLAEGLSANDFRRLPREVVRPSADIVNGTASIYEETF